MPSTPPPASPHATRPGGLAALARWLQPGASRSALACAAAVLGLAGAAAAGVLAPGAAGRAAAVFAALACAGTALWHLHRLVGHADDAVASLRRFAQRIGVEETGPDSRRGESTLATSILDEVTLGVESAFDERERRWKARAKLSADWYWETDAADRIAWVSEDLTSHLKLGLQPAELLGRRFDEVPHFHAPEGGWPVLLDRFAQRKPCREIEIAVRRPGRSTVWIALSARPRRAADGRHLGYEGVGRDVTEHRLAFRRLRESERRYAVIADLSADWYWESDAEHRLTFLGPTAHEMFGELASAAIGHTRWAVHDSGASVEEWARHRADLDARRPFRGFEVLVRRTARGAMWVSLAGVPRHDAQGGFLGYHGVGRDITLRKRAEKVLLVRNAQLERLVAARTAELEQSNRDLEAFSRQLAHELRTPIGHVVGFADLLRSRAWERLAPDEREWLRLSSQSGRAMSSTVTALLELARSGSEALVREAVDVSALATAVAAELAPQERRAPVAWHIAPGLAAHCSGSLLRVALANLMANGAKFTREVPAPRVEVGASMVNGEQVFHVADNGAGFDAARAGALFQPFVRLHDAQRFEGTGVGLSIVRRIVERHGGWVRARSTPGGGARFEFTLAARGLAGDDGESTDDTTEAAA